MNRRKKQLPISHERWLISYADFITLLFAFFVVLFSSAQGDRKKQTLIAAAMKKAFSQYGIFEGHARKPGFDSSPGDSGGKLLALPLASAPENSLEDQEQIVQRIRNAIETFGGKAKEPQPPPAKTPRIVPQPGEDLRRFISFRQHPEGLAVSLQAAGFFDSGSATLRADAMPLLSRIARSLPATPIRVEGHTDNVAIHSAVFPSNWELSTARAAVIGRVLLERSYVHPSALALAGYAEFHPIASNATEQGRARNRRVDIVLLRFPAAPLAASQQQPQPQPVAATLSPSSRPAPSR